MGYDMWRLSLQSCREAVDIGRNVGRDRSNAANRLVPDAMFGVAEIVHGVTSHAETGAPS